MDVILSYISVFIGIFGTGFGVYSHGKQKKVEDILGKFADAVVSQTLLVREQLEDAAKIQNSSCFPQLKAKVETTLIGMDGLVELAKNNANAINNTTQ